MGKRINTVAILVLITISPAWANQYTDDGIKAYRQGDYPKAEQLYRKALAEETDSDQLAAVYRNLSILYKAQGKDGSDFTNKADALDPPIKPKYVKGATGSTQSQSSVSNQQQ